MMKHQGDVEQESEFRERGRIIIREGNELYVLYVREKDLIVDKHCGSAKCDLART